MFWYALRVFDYLRRNSLNSSFIFWRHCARIKSIQHAQKRRKTYERIWKNVENCCRVNHTREWNEENFFSKEIKTNLSSIKSRNSNALKVDSRLLILNYVNTKRKISSFQDLINIHQLSFQLNIQLIKCQTMLVLNANFDRKIIAIE